MENFIMNLYRAIDKEKVQFDFVEHTESDPVYVSEVEAMGGHVYRLPRLTSHPFRNLKGIRKLVEDNQYKAVVRHTPNALIAPQLLAAKKAGAVAICHSHNTTDPKKFLHFIGRQLLKNDSIVKMACSEAAGKWMYGNKPFREIHNAIDIDRFTFDKAKRNRIRSEFGIAENAHVYGNIANFLPSKNHTFLLDIYSKIAGIDSGAVFFCLGRGELLDEMKQKAKELGIEGRVHFTGSRPDADAFMSVFDVMIFPSLFEGLPLTLIEAQASGLHILLSDTITRNVEVTTGLLEYKSLDESPSEWANNAIKLANDKSVRAYKGEEIINAGYDIKGLASWYEEYLTKL
ncbi:MAG: glycosyltransferase [Lachnospiraceae bacterium]|nr:glycosyltransferase [Candidatus Merdinaster equi]